MKKLPLIAAVICSAAITTATAQQRTSSASKAPTKNPASITNHWAPDKQPVNSSGSFSSFGSYGARSYKYPYSANQLHIADPTIKAYNSAYGSDSISSKIGVLGVPQRTYGVANGHILFRSTGATTSGTITGSGSVGTGSSAGSAGAGNQVLGVNGKSPYAGPGMWGTKVAGKEIKPTTPTDNKQPVKEKQ